MRYLGSRYVQYVNFVYRRSGTLWEGRFKSSLVDQEQYLLTCYRYIELNPVRANMVGTKWGRSPILFSTKQTIIIEPTQN